MASTNTYTSPEEVMYKIQQIFQGVPHDDPDYLTRHFDAIKFFGKEIKPVPDAMYTGFEEFKVFFSDEGILTSLRLNDRDDEEFEGTIPRVLQYLIIPMDQITGSIPNEDGTEFSYTITQDLKRWLCQTFDYPDGMWNTNLTVSFIKNTQSANTSTSTSPFTECVTTPTPDYSFSSSPEHFATATSDFNDAVD